ncbi:MAG: 3-methyl-2-oxobutanoate hydroxymethyltransferase [Anaerovoracaceae bacterium]|nr:3-methyl-2-oxobutanoate hydroxymethyltransferase [Anaerovoracaceae bacterium]
MSQKKLTVPQFRELKEAGTKFTMVTAYDYTFAQMLNESETEMILVGDSLANIIMGEGSTLPATMDIMIHHIRSVVKGAPTTFVVGDMPFGTYQTSPEQAVDSAVRMMKEGGCDCVKLEGGLNMVDRVKAIVNAGIPVMGHIGLTPQSSSALGGHGVQGKDSGVADKLLADAKALDEAGVFSMVLECIPKGVGKRITEEVKCSTISCGAGPYCDGQNMNMYDLEGMFSDFVPKFVKHYAELRGEMIAGLNEYHKETQAGTFPDADHSYNAVVPGYEV